MTPSMLDEPLRFAWRFSKADLDWLDRSTQAVSARYRTEYIWDIIHDEGLANAKFSKL